jgi:superfamily II helicase
MTIVKKNPDTVEKFQKMVKLAKNYEKVTTDMNLEGFNAKVHPNNMSVQYWQDAFEDFLHDTKKLKKTVTKTDDHLYNIILCWTIKNDYCVCDSIIETMQNYFTNMGLSVEDTTKTTFPDRTEFCQNYKFSGSKSSYDLLMKSAEYILDITTLSAYEKCNVGIFGKKL